MQNADHGRRVRRASRAWCTWRPSPIGAALAGLAGAMMAPLTGVVPSLGLAFIAKIFITVIVGGPRHPARHGDRRRRCSAPPRAWSPYLSTPIYGQVAMLGPGAGGLASVP